MDYQFLDVMSEKNTKRIPWLSHMSPVYAKNTLKCRNGMGKMHGIDKYRVAF